VGFEGRGDYWDVREGGRDRDGYGGVGAADDAFSEGHSGVVVGWECWRRREWVIGAQGEGRVNTVVFSVVMG